MSGKIQHDPETFMLALASAYFNNHVRQLTTVEKAQWQRVARCAIEHLALDAAASAAAGASEMAQVAAMKVLKRVLDILTVAAPNYDTRGGLDVATDSGRCGDVSRPN